MGALDANGSAAQASEGDFEGSSGEESGDRQRADDAAPGCRVCGRIRGAFPEGATVEAVVRTLSRAGLAEIVAARANPGAEGEYELRFTAPADTSEPADVTLALRLRGPDGRVLVESTAIPSFPQELELDLRAPRGAVSRSEYELLEAHIAGELRTGAEGLDGLGAEDVGEVADWLDVEPEHVRLFQQARKLGAETGLPAPLFYSLGQAGLPTVLEELIEVPLHELETTLEEAVAAGVAPPALR
ncbi:MAG TPA: hypothetical protein VGK73_39580, partial [Polyangiaceae bacterium]